MGHLEGQYESARCEGEVYFASLEQEIALQKARFAHDLMRYKEFVQAEFAKKQRAVDEAS